MAALSQAERNRVSRWFQRDQNLGSCAFTKPELAEAVNALDDYLDANASAINTALPQPFRGAATAGQKALLLCYVVMRRYGAAPTGNGD